MMDLFKSVTELIVSLEKKVLSGAESLVDAEENKLETLLKQLSPEELTLAQEQELTKRVYEFTTARYQGEAAQAKILQASKLHVVYDLDDCLIKSVQLAENEPSSLHTTVVERVKGVEGLEVTHVDDDLLRYKTVLRRYARLLLVCLGPFCTQYVFTSASRGYMVNVVSLVEAGYHPESDQCKQGASERKFVFFETPRRSSTDFPGSSLRVTGKDVDEVVVQEGRSKAILLDDAVAYHKAQPTRGIWINRFPNEPGAIPDKNDVDRELLRVMPLLVRAVLVGNSKNHNEELPALLYEAQSDQYWRDLMVQILRTYGKANVDLDVTTSPTATWKIVAKVLSDYAEEQSLFSPSGTDKNDWRTRLENRWQAIVKKEKKLLLKTFASVIKKRQAAQAEAQVVQKS